MVSFSCEVCNDTVIKKKLDQHTQRCYGAYFSCIDCSVTFEGTQYRNHTSCISEAEKYEKALYKGPKKQTRQQNTGKQVSNNAKQPQAVESAKTKESPIEKKVKSKDPKKPNTDSKNNHKGLGAFLKPNKEQNMYKIIKKASQEDSRDIKEVLKSLKIVINDDGQIQIV